MCTKQAFDMITQKIAKTYRSIYGKDLEQVILYGSYARGDYDENSDIDMAAIVKGDRMTLQKMLKNVWAVSSDLELEYEIIVSPTVIPYDEFERYKDVLPYYRNIAAEGVKVHV